MRIAYPMRVDAADKSGGDVLQVMRYIEEGKRLCVGGEPLYEGVMITDLRCGFAGFDLVHLTNIDRPVDTYCSFLRAREADKPVFLSPIHHSYEEIERFEREGRGGVVGSVSGSMGFRRLEYLRSLHRSFQYPQLARPTMDMMRCGMRNAQQTVLAGVDRILVLTEKEKLDLKRNFGEIPDGKFARLRNGIESNCMAATQRDIDVCMVGRIEARKNQIAVLKVMQRMGLRAVFVGSENQNHKVYCKRFREMLVDSGSEYRGAISHEETLGVMRRARLHISASWYEVLSLVDLEAYSAGCGVVSSKCGGTREILGDEAEYVDPGSEASIGEGIRKMFERTSSVEHGSTRRSNGIAGNETWEDVGASLGNLYRASIYKDSNVATDTHSKSRFLASLKKGNPS
jgi:glycosyltransferase involved in cell wall biosynthesis